MFVWFVFILSHDKLQREGGEGGASLVFRKISPHISLYYDPSLIKNFYKATNCPLLITSTPFCAYDLTGRYSSIFFKLTRLPLIPVEYKLVIECITSSY